MAERPLLSAGSAARNSVLVSVSLLVTSVVGAVQGVLLVFIAGEGPQTDAFLAVYALYSALILFGASLRGSIVPLFGLVEPEAEFRARAAETLGRTLLIGLTLLALVVALSPAAALLQTRGLGGSAQSTAVIALLILAPAAYLQLHAASLAGLLSATRRFDFAAAAYVGASCASLVISIVLLAVVGVVGMAIGLLAGASVLTGSLVLYVRRFDLHSRISPRWLRERKQYALAGLLAAGAAPGIAIQLDLGLSLAVIPHHTGEITAYSYAFFLCSLILTVSAVPIAIVSLPDLVARLAADGDRVAREFFQRVLPYAFAVLVPLASLLIAFGRPVLLTGLGPALSRQTIQLLYELAVIFCALALVLAPLYLCGAVTLAMKRYGILLRMGAVLVIVNAVLVALASPGGSRAVAAAQVVAAAIGTGYLLRVTFGARCGSVVAGAAKAVRPAFALSLVIFALRAPLGWDPGVAISVAVAAMAVVAYAALVVRLWPSGSAPFVDLVRRRGMVRG